jgi:hypothetical protein
MSNAKSVKPKVIDIEIGGETYKIKFTLNSFIELEDMYGDVESAMAKLSGTPITDENGTPVMDEITDKDGNKKMEQKRKVSFKVIRDFIYAGLISEQPNVTKADVGNFEFTDFTDVMTKLMSALTGSLPEDKTEGEGSKN